MRRSKAVVGVPSIGLGNITRTNHSGLGLARSFMSTRSFYLSPAVFPSSHHRNGIVSQLFTSQCNRTRFSNPDLRKEHSFTKSQEANVYAFLMFSFGIKRLLIGSPLKIVHACIQAAAEGSVEALRGYTQLEEIMKGSEGWQVWGAAAKMGRIDVLKWFKEKDFQWDPIATAKAAEGGHLEALKWLRAAGCPFGHMATNRAAYGGNVEVMDWLIENGCPLDSASGLCYTAAIRGNLDMLIYLKEVRNIQGDEDTCAVAAQLGHTKVLKWLRDTGCPWDVSTTYKAALGGQLDTLMYARDNGCPWDATVFSAAAEGGNIEVL